MRPPLLEIVEKNCRVSIRKAIDEVLSGRMDATRMGEVCQRYRMLAACSLFRTGLGDALTTHLCHSANAHLHFLSVTSQVVLATQSLPVLWDACAAGNWGLAASIARRVVSDRDENREYEDDFVYCRFLVEAILAWVPDGRRDVGEPGAVLQRLTEVLAGAEDVRVEICTALQGQNSELFNTAVSAYMEQKESEFQNLRAADAVDLEAAVSVERLSVEGLALVALADLRGMETHSDYLLIPSLARAKPGQSFPDAFDWRAVGG